MTAQSPLVCAACLDPATLRMDAEWVQTVVCPTCGRSALFFEAFREADAYEADFLCGGGLQREAGASPSRFITSRMLCALRRTGSLQPAVSKT